MVIWFFFGTLALTAGIIFPLSIKWELDKSVAIPGICLIGVLTWAFAVGLMVFTTVESYTILGLEVLFIASLSTLFMLWRFYRDPERVPLEVQNVVLAPADGEIKYIKRIREGEVPLFEKNGKKFSLQDFIQAPSLPEAGYLIGISMTYLDVHVNRAPISGTIALLKHINGHFFSLKRQEAVFQNERLLMIIDHGWFKLGIVQIASRMVRNIVPYIQESQPIQIGDRIGMIRFGSQVDLILPKLPSMQLEVSPGQKVKAGVTVMAHFEISEPA